eukprot:Gregarina_sp_Pseudo_9__2124@NODE_2481_length_982_cov_4_518558_g2283_i0_p3_GENE_NODE_2481_length_982_cov_4_518558_g2283_i0NODE_2481_length_982_cov_4_518558_g2283_i0_p3_ORF_typecomplete_len130_score11_99_NODE_2481_length_982_cov_4_518558_g2283_i081470
MTRPFHTATQGPFHTPWSRTKSGVRFLSKRGNFISRRGSNLKSGGRNFILVNVWDALTRHSVERFDHVLGESKAWPSEPPECAYMVNKFLLCHPPQGWNETWESKVALRIFKAALWTEIQARQQAGVIL